MMDVLSVATESMTDWISAKAAEHRRYSRHERQLYETDRRVIQEGKRRIGEDENRVRKLKAEVDEEHEKLSNAKRRQIELRSTHEKMKEKLEQMKKDFGRER